MIMKLATFDIFDTTLLRRCGKPEEVFLLTGQRLFPDNKACAEAFAIWRKGLRGQTLTEMYSPDRCAGMGQIPQSALMEAELATESDMLTVNPAVKKRIDKCRKEGYSIKFLSDMYLPSEFLAQVLRREGCMTDDDEVIVSCEWNARKDDGTLYDKVRLKLAPKEWIHHGDHPHSDVKMAHKKRVITGQVFTPFTPVESLWMKASSQSRNGEVTRRLAGICRNVRLKAGNSPQTILAADFIAPLYIPYVAFVLEQARSMGLKDLYFLSRDSYILYRIAQQLPHDGIELHYLFVSRKSLTLPYLCNSGRDGFMAIAEHNTLKGKKVTGLLKQLHTSREELNSLHGITFDYERITSAAQQDDFLSKIFDGQFSLTMQQKGEAQLNTLLKYFSQEGLLTTQAAGMVDVGWMGSSRLMINSILHHAGAKEVDFFYLGVRGDVFPPSAGNYTTFFMPGQLDTNATALIENYFSVSPYPTTTGYAEVESGKIEPVFPHGKKYNYNFVVETNVEVATAITNEMKCLGVPFTGNTLFQWAKLSIDTIADVAVAVDFSPLEQVDLFDGTPTVKHLSALELVKLLLLGDHITAFDKGSLALTLGHGATTRLWPLQRLTSRLRTAIYRRFILR